MQSNQFKPTFKNVLYWALGSNGWYCQIREYFKILTFTLLLQMNCNSPCFCTSKESFKLSFYVSFASQQPFIPKKEDLFVTSYRQLFWQFFSVSPYSSSPTISTAENISATRIAKQQTSAKITMHFCWDWKTLEEEIEVKIVKNLSRYCKHYSLV